MTPPRLHASRVCLLGLLAVAGATLIGPRPAHRARPHVLVITVDTVRADHCSVYGYTRPTTPTLERVARGGAVFEDAYAPMATTAPAHASLFTGLAPARHGVIKNGLVLSLRFRTLAEHLAAAGYDTAAVVSSFAVHGKFGLRQGFAMYDDHFDATPSTRRWEWEGHIQHGAFDRDGRHTTMRGIRWLRHERNRRNPFFLWLHYFDPHQPYDPAPPYDRSFVNDTDGGDALATTIALYDAEIRKMDDAIGTLLAELDAQNLTAATLIVVAGDHGEGLMDHGWMHHGLQLYEEAVRVPLVMSLPTRIPAGQRLRGPAQLADLTPTILELTGTGGAPPPADRPGAAISLVPALTGMATLDPERPVFFQRRHYREEKRLDVQIRGAKHAVRIGPWKYVAAPDEDSYELYDLVADPGETRNLTASAPAEARRLAASLAEWRRTDAREAQRALVPAGDAARLRALGYVD